MKFLKAYAMFEFRQQPTETVVGLLALCEATGRIFLVQRNDQNRYWSLLSGGQDEGEQDLETIEREMGEELRFKGFDELAISPAGEEIAAGGRRLFKLYFARCEREFQPTLDDENLSWGWFDPKGISKINGQSHFYGLPSRLYPGLEEKIARIYEENR
jgi:8-oxo-dGTP pyrophosphatase MutT (NUDIX family)